MRTTVLLSLASILSAVSLRADDVTLKNGKVYENLTMVSETSTSYVFLDESGRRITLAKSSIESIVKKPTVRGDFIEREKAVDRKDPKALTELALWARERNLEPEAGRLLQDALKRDPSFVPAHEALGNVFEDGKWISAREIERREAEAAAKRNARRGFKLVQGRWLSPVDQARQRKRLVEHDGHWVPQDMKTRIEKEGWVWMEGAFVPAEHKARMDAGERLSGKAWKPVAELDGEHSTMENPWVLSGEAVEIRTNCRHREAVQFLDAAEDAYALLRDLFQGAEPPGLYEDRGRLLVYVGRDLAFYQDAGRRRPGSDRESLKSSSGGVFYSTRDGGAVYTYRESNLDWTRFWIAQGLAHAYVARFRDYQGVPEAALEAVAGYASAARGGSYRPNWWHYSTWINNAAQPLRPASGILDCGMRPEHSFVQAGFFLHYLRTVNDKAVLRYMDEFLYGENPGNLQALRQDVSGEDDDAFAAFAEAYRKEFKPWDR